MASSVDPAMPYPCAIASIWRWQLLTRACFCVDLQIGRGSGGSNAPPRSGDLTERRREASHSLLVQSLAPSQANFDNRAAPAKGRRGRGGAATASTEAASHSRP